MEKVGHYGLIAQQVLVPGFFGSLFFRLIWFLVILHIRFFALAVQILSHQVKHCVNALVRVVLAEAGKSGSILSKNALEKLGSHRILVHIPHLVHQLRIRHHKSSLCSKRILLLKLCDKLESTFEEELRELICVGEALQTGVHVARVAKVLESHDSILSVFGHILHAHLVQLVVSLRAARRQVEVLILLATVFFAVPHALALALNFEYCSSVAKLTSSDLHAPLVLKLEGESRRGDLDHDHFVVEVMVRDHKA